MSDPLLPVPTEEVADLGAERELEDVEDDEQPDVLTGAAGSPEEAVAAEDAAEPGVFRTPVAGDRLSDAELEDDLD